MTGKSEKPSEQVAFNIAFQKRFSSFMCMQYKLQMTDTAQQLAVVEEALKQAAQELGELNISNNQTQQANEALAQEIQALQKRIVKKTHMIEQENKDKAIIHQKLVKAESRKQQIEIAVASRGQQQVEEKATKEGASYEMKERAPSKVQAKPKEETVAPLKQEKQEVNKVEAPKPTEPSKPVEIPSKPVPQAKKQEVTPGLESFYGNADKGDYQPPALFLDDGDEQESSQEQDGQTLQKLREKLQKEREELNESDDD